MNVISATAITIGTNHDDTASASRWIGARDRWASLTMRTICARSVSRPTRSARITNTSGAIHRAAGDRCLGHFLDRNGLASHHRFVYCGRAFEDDAVNRNALAWTNAQSIADGHMLERHVMFGAVGFNSTRGLWRQTEQATNRRARPAARAQLEHLTEQHEYRR